MPPSKSHSTLSDLSATWVQTAPEAGEMFAAAAQVVATSAAAVSLASSQTPSQWLRRQTALVGIATSAPTNPLRLANSAARVLQESLAPIHDRATAIAKRQGAA